MTGLILNRSKPGRHQRTQREPGRFLGDLGEYLDARTQGLARPAHRRAWLAGVRREWRRQQNG